MTINSIGIASDHAGFELKKYLKTLLTEQGYRVNDFGTHSTDSCDYPQYGHALATSVENGESNMGIAICGTGNGISMTVNHHKSIRGALCWQPELAELARQHNDANIIILPARFITNENAAACVNIFLTTEFEGGRHQKRIDAIPIVD